MFSEKGQGILSVWSSIATILPFLAGIVIWLFFRFRKKQQPEAITLSPEQAARTRQQMLAKVHTMWIKGVLEQSLYQIARLELGLKEAPEQINHPAKLQLEQAGYHPRELPNGITMIKVFKEFNNTLLLLGAPGSGKTTLLLEFTRDLIQEAEKEKTHPIPVVFNLSSWAVDRSTIADWLIDELNNRYDVPKRLATYWIKHDEVFPLFDGLDEVSREHREECVESMNTFRKEHGLLPLVVCSRYYDYSALTNKFSLPSAVVIQPLTPEQIDSYLSNAGDALAHIRILVKSDVTLLELLDTPLMLSIMQLAFQNNIHPTTTSLQGGNLAERRKHLFDTYIAAMFTRRKSIARYSQEKTMQWLQRLAQSMKEREQTIFYLERMQLDLLPNKLHTMQKILSLISVGIIFEPFYVIFGLAMGLSFGPFYVIFGLAFGLAYGLAYGLAFGLANSL